MTRNAEHRCGDPRLIEVLRGVRADEYRTLWARMPGSLGVVLWIAAMAALGWETGLWLGALIVVVLAILCRVIPSSFRPVELVVDVAYVTVMNSTIVRLLWLALLADLWLVQARGPFSILMLLAAFILAMIWPFAAGKGLDRVLPSRIK